MDLILCLLVMTTLFKYYSVLKSRWNEKLHLDPIHGRAMHGPKTPSYCLRISLTLTYFKPDSFSAYSDTCKHTGTFIIGLKHNYQWRCLVKPTNINKDCLLQRSISFSVSRTLCQGPLGPSIVSLYACIKIP